MIERAKGQVLVWAELPEAQRARDSDPDAIIATTLALRRRPMPPAAERCEAASQGNTSDQGSSLYQLAKTGRFFRCVQRKKRGLPDARFCHRHQAIMTHGVAAVRT